MIGHSSEKRHRQSVVRNARNNQLKGRARRQRTHLHAEVAGGNLKEAQKLLPRYYSLVDRAVKRGALHARTAARYKSRLSSVVNGALNPQTAPASSTTSSATSNVSIASAHKRLSSKRPAPSTTAKTTKASPRAS